MSNNGQVISFKPDYWQHSHHCYVCKKHYDCSWNFCKDQVMRCCKDCIHNFQAQAEEKS